MTDSSNDPLFLNSLIEGTGEILDLLGIADDEQLWLRLTAAEIEYQGMQADVPLAFTEETFNGEIHAQLHQLHAARIAQQLLDIVDSALGYYALPVQSEGQNEPVLGAESAVQLLRLLKSQETDLTQIKTRLHELAGNNA